MYTGPTPFSVTKSVKVQWFSSRARTDAYNALKAAVSEIPYVRTNFISPKNSFSSGKTRFWHCGEREKSRATTEKQRFSRGKFVRARVAIVAVASLLAVLRARRRPCRDPVKGGGCGTVVRGSRGVLDGSSAAAVAEFRLLFCCSSRPVVRGNNNTQYARVLVLGRTSLCR